MPCHTEILTAEGEPIAGIEDLFEPGRRFVDRPILLGKQAKLPCRIVVWRVPQEVANRRRQKLLATAREKGYAPPSRERLAWCDWTIFVTNVPRELLSPEEIGVLYRARWQIEIMFKRWKSLGRVADLTGATVDEETGPAVVAPAGDGGAALAAGGVRLGRASLQPPSGLVTIRESPTTWSGALALDALIEEIVRIQGVLRKVARRDKRKQPGTFELLSDPSLLGYES